MSKALVVKNADFSENKLATVTFGEIPCTTLSLTASATITTLNGTATLIAVKTPANTTDIITWTSSNSTVATVSNGVVTAHGEGTATITATCGAQTATCTVTVAYTMEGTGAAMLVVKPNGTTAIYDYTDWTTGGSAIRPITVGINSGLYHAYGTAQTLCEGGLKDVYPIPIPAGAKKINVTCPDLAPLIVYYSMTEKSSNTSLYREAAKVLDGETYAGGTQWSLSSWTYDARTFTIPATEGIDGYTLSFNARNTTVHDAFSLDDVTIEYLYD